MQPPRTVPAAPASPARSQPLGGRALGSMAAAIGRGLARIESRLLAILDRAYDAGGRDVARLEATLLLRLRRGLAPSLREPTAPGATGERIDVVLADGLLEAVDAALATVADLEAEPVVRFARYLDFCHELLGESSALDVGDLSRERRSAQALRARLATPGDAAWAGATAQQLGQLFAALSDRLERHSPRLAPTLLDEVLRGPASEAASLAPR